MYNPVQCDECRKWKCTCKPEKAYCQHCGNSYNRLAFDDCPTCAALDDVHKPETGFCEDCNKKVGVETYKEEGKPQVMVCAECGQFTKPF